MTFYLKPPGGRIILKVIEEGVRSRLKVLMSICDRKSLDTQGVNIEHLFENSHLDRVSHFILRLSCLFSPEFQVFFIQSETKFFQERLSSYDHTDTRKMLLILQRHLNDIKPLVESHESCSLFLATRLMCTEVLKGKTLKHVFNKQHSDSCREHVILVNFQHCSSLVRKRDVELKKGICHVHCGAWAKLFTCFFQTLLNHGVKHLAKSSISQEIIRDIRLRSVISQTLQMFSKHYHHCGENSLGAGRIKADTVDMESEFFPPCALNILQSLRSKHRVGHHARIQLSLFLKGVGMSVNDAIEFWKEEYMKTTCCSEKETTCLHSWKKDSSRYVYNIQHLYGLQGARKKYHSRSCSELQSAVAKCEEGCPFAKMSSRDLIQVLPRVVRESCGPDGSMLNTSLGKVMDFASQGKAREACEACFAVHCAAVKTVDVNYDSLHKGVRDHSSNERSFKVKRSSCEMKNSVEVTGEHTGIRDRTKSGYSTLVTTEIIPNEGNTSRVQQVQINRDSSLNKVDFFGGLSLAEKSTSAIFAQEITINSPTQYYLALKSGMISLK